MKIKDHKIYASYANGSDLMLRGVAYIGNSLADSIETLLAEGKNFDEALLDSYVLREVIDILETDYKELVEFLQKCWVHGEEFTAALWRLRDRRRQERKGPVIEIDLG